MVMQIVAILEADLLQKIHAIAHKQGLQSSQLAARELHQQTP